MRFTILILILSSLTIQAMEGLRKHSSNPLQAEAVMESLLPWETPISGFFIRSHHGVPLVDRENFFLEIDGLVEKPLRLTLKDLEDYPPLTLHAVLECAGNWRSRQKPRVAGVQWDKGAVGNAEWTGVLVADLLKAAKVKPEAKFARIEGTDKPALPSVPAFVRSVPLAKMLDRNTLLALKMNRETLPLLHGGPLRLILPNWYGQNWMKWVTHITLTETEDQGFYMKKGYRMPKTPLKPGEKWDSATGVPVQELRVQSLIVSPAPDQEVPIGKLTIRGKAFSGAGTIAKVEISLDRGKSWKLARLEPAHTDGGWQAFELDVENRRMGKFSAMSRATDSTQQAQPLKFESNPPGYLGNAADEVSYKVGKVSPVGSEELVQERCLICHTQELIDSQRLSPEGWEKVVTKMETFGAKISKEEHLTLVAYLAKRSPHSEAATTDYETEVGKLMESELVKGNSDAGEKLYASHCALCHGDKGEGKTGPRLSGKQVSRSNFWLSVVDGKRSMPSFRESLKENQIADLHAYLFKRN